MIVYRLTCLATGRIYVGITEKTLEQRVAAHFAESRRQGERSAKRPLMRAMLKHPREMWVAEVIGSANTRAELCAIERERIAVESANDPRFGYNATVGGEGLAAGFVFSTEARDAMRARRRKTAEAIELSAAFHRGRRRSDDTKARMSQSRADWWDRFRRGEAQRRPDPKINPERDVAICLAHFEKKSLRLAGQWFGITTGAAHAAVRRVCDRINLYMTSVDPRYEQHPITAPVHPCWTEFALFDWRQEKGSTP